MTDTELAYAAGLLDGSGCTMRLMERGPHVRIVTRKQEVAEWMCRHFGGGVHRSGREESGWWRWDLYRKQQVANMLANARPYMVGNRKRSVHLDSWCTMEPGPARDKLGAQIRAGQNKRS